MNAEDKEPPILPELYCRDFNLTRAFYLNVLGFRIMYERPEDKFMRIERQGAQLMFEELDLSGDNRVWLVAPAEYPFGRGISFQIDTTNVDAFYKKVRESSATIFLPMEEKWYRADDSYLGNRQFIVQDPDGYLLRFAEDIGDRPSPP